MVRILKEGGRLVITDLDEHEHDWLREEMADLWLGFDRHQIAEWLAMAGLDKTEVACAGCDCCAESSQGEPAAISIFVASGRKAGRR